MREGRDEGGRDEEVGASEEGLRTRDGGPRRVDAADGGGRRVEVGFGTIRGVVEDGRGGGGIDEDVGGARFAPELGDRLGGGGMVAVLEGGGCGLDCGCGAVYSRSRSVSRDV